MTAFTPGPWEAGRSDMKSEINSCFGKWVYAGDRFIAGATSQDIENWDEVMANAHLIAAAPEMYEALVALSQQLCSLKEEKGDLFCKMETLCDIAIAKAQGDQGRVEVLSELPQLAKAEGKEEE